MHEQTIVWRSDFEDIPLDSYLVETLGGVKTEYRTSEPVLVKSRGDFQLGEFILWGGELVFLRNDGVKLSTGIIQQWAFLE